MGFLIQGYKTAPIIEVFLTKYLSMHERLNRCIFADCHISSGVLLNRPTHAASIGICIIISIGEADVGVDFEHAQTLAV